MANDPLRFKDLFDQQSLDFNRAVDVVDIFNNVAEQINELESNDPLAIVQRAQEEQTAFFANSDQDSFEEEMITTSPRQQTINNEPSLPKRVEPERTTRVEPNRTTTGINDRGELESAGNTLLPKLSTGASNDSKTVSRGSFALAKEARLDSSGKLEIYNPPSSDKNNREVAGFGDVTSPKKYKQLSSLVQQGKHEEAKQLAESFLSERGKPYTNQIKDDRIADIANGVIHHRGEGGFEKIISYLGEKNAGKASGKALESLVDTPNFERRWLLARAKQERENEESVWKSQGRKGTLSSFRRKRAKELGGPINITGQGSFGKGLYNRWVEEAEKLKTQ